MLALFGAHQILHVSRTRVNLKLNETDVTDFLLTLFSILYTTIASFFFLHTHVSSQCLTMPSHQYQCQLPLISRYRYGQNSRLRFGIRYLVRIIEYVTRIQRNDKSMNEKWISKGGTKCLKILSKYNSSVQILVFYCVIMFQSY